MKPVSKSNFPRWMTNNKGVFRFIMLGVLLLTPIWAPLLSMKECAPEIKNTLQLAWQGLLKGFD